MESQLDALRLKSLEERLRTSERWTKLSMFGWVVALILMLALMSTGNVHARDAQPDKLRVRELTIVDGEGRERIVIAAPLPDPVMNGKVQKRIRVVAAGVQFKGTENEAASQPRTTARLCSVSTTKPVENARIRTTYQRVDREFIFRVRTIKRLCLH